MFLCIVLATICLSSSQVLASNNKPYYKVEDAEILFQEFVEEHKKVYKQSEYFERLEIFKGNLKDINERNAMFPDTIFAVNHFADLKPHELQTYNGFKFSNEFLTQEEVLGSGTPDSFDWRDHNAVTHVKDQDFCRSCYIFSAVGNIEGQYAIVHNQSFAFSEKQCLACLKSGNCDGGDMADVMQELADTKKKLEKEEDYPYNLYDDTRCHEDPNKGIALVINRTNTKMNEESMKNKLVSYGPLSISIDAKDFHYYDGGILKPHKCSHNIDHSVLLVGYGEEGGTKFWTIKNSWGLKWGEKGYVRLQRGVGACSIGQYVAYSTVA